MDVPKEHCKEVVNKHHPIMNTDSCNTRSHEICDKPLEKIHEVVKHDNDPEADQEGNTSAALTEGAKENISNKWTKPAHYHPLPVTKPHINDVEDEDSSDEENDEPPVTMGEFKTQPDKPRIIDVEDRDNNEKETDEPPTPMCEFGKSPVKPQIIDMDDDDSFDEESEKVRPIC